MNKMRIVIDVDGVILDTEETMANFYNSEMKDKEGFKPIKGSDIYYYDANGCMPEYTNKDILRIFDSDFFWHNIGIKYGCVEAIDELCEDDRFEVVIWSYGTCTNRIRKLLYLTHMFPKVDDIVLSRGSSVMKSEICNDAILIDDLQDNLNNPKAFNVCFTSGIERDYNKDFKGFKAKDWTEVKEWRD